MTFRSNRPRQTAGLRVKPCFFCQEKQEPSLKELELLRRYISERGKIFNRARSGICRKHQAKLSQEIKRARFLSLFPFTVKVR